MDELIGVLDSEIFEDIMNLLKEIFKDKFIIMVIYNVDLVKRFLNRIVRLKDGEVIGDINLYDKKDNKVLKNEISKLSMSYFIVLRLFFKNMFIKKIRMFIIVFVGFIGIIGVVFVMFL